MAETKVTINGETDAGGAWQTWVPTIGGFSVNPTGGIYTYSQIGKMVTLAIAMPNAGTSNAATITLSLPVTSANRTSTTWVGYGSVVDNGVVKASPGMITITPASTTLTVVLDFQFSAFTNYGSKRMQYGAITYEAA